MATSSKGDIVTFKTRFHALVFASQAAVLCCVAFADDPFEEYFQRKNGVTFSGGDAKAINSATHIIDPWPLRSRNTHIPGDGSRMQGAIERYRDVSKLPQAPRPIQSEYDASTNIQSSGGGGGGK
jgi:hypothetical protein